MLTRLLGELDRVTVMAGIRLLVAGANLIAGYLMYRSQSVPTSIAINGLLGSVLPLVFMLIMAIGVTGLAGRVEWWKIALIVAGSLLIVLGTR